LRSLCFIRWGLGLDGYYGRHRGHSAKLQPEFAGPYRVVEALRNHMYMVECAGQVSVQNEACLKPSWGSRNAVNEVPLIFEPRKQSVARDQVRSRPECEIILPWAVYRAREPRCLPSSAEKPASPDYTHPKLLPDTEPAQESPSNSDEEGVPVEALNSVMAHLVAEAQREEAPLVLKRSQLLPSCLWKFVCDCLQSSKLKPDGSPHGELLWTAWELCKQERKYSLFEREIVGQAVLNSLVSAI